MALDSELRVFPDVILEDVRSPTAFAPHRTLMRSLAVDRFRRLIFQPFHRVVDVARGECEQQVRMRPFD